MGRKEMKMPLRSRLKERAQRKWAKKMKLNEKLLGQMAKRMLMELLFRIALIIWFVMLESASPFIREVQPEEIWLYRNPIVKESVLEKSMGGALSFILNPIPMIIIPVIILFCQYVSVDARGRSVPQEAFLSFSLSVPLTGIIINIMKVLAGRLRPDYLARCYGMQYYKSYYDLSEPCTNHAYSMFDGRKSFPSGHTGLAAACFGFMAYYAAGQLRTFHELTVYRGSRLYAFLTLMLMPVIVGIARTCDYKHHWQDVIVGGIIGYVVSYFSYRTYFPSLTHDLCDYTYLEIDDENKMNYYRQTSSLDFKEVFQREQQEGDNSSSPDSDTANAMPASTAVGTNRPSLFSNHSLRARQSRSSSSSPDRSNSSRLLQALISRRDEEELEMAKCRVVLPNVLTTASDSELNSSHGSSSEYEPDTH